MKKTGHPLFTRLSPDDLQFDPSNPRFSTVLSGEKKQEDIQKILENEPHLALELVDSFLENGYIDYEPIVVRKAGKKYIVVEGNRRLAAIRHILDHQDLYRGRDSKINDLKKIPALVFPKNPTESAQAEQRVYLGVRHLFGLREWSPESKARFLNGHLKTKKDLERLLKELNIAKREIFRFVVPYRIRKISEELWTPFNDQDFWIFGEAIGRPTIRSYVELEIDEDSLKVLSVSKKQLKKLLEYLYGLPGKDGRTGKRIKETRDISLLAKVLKSRKAAAELEKGNMVTEAALYIDTPEESNARLKDIVHEIKVLIRKITSKSDRISLSRSLLSSFNDFEDQVKKYLKNVE